MTFPQQGGCFCGAVRYRQLGPALSVQHCHCPRCRKLYGVLCAQGAVIERTQIEIAGEEHLGSYSTSPSFATSFCRTCGCPLFAYEASERTLMYFSPATLDDGRHPGHPPAKESHIYVSRKAEWDRFADDLPKYETSSPDEIITETQRAAKP